MKLTRRDGAVALVTALVLAVVVAAFVIGKASGHPAAAPAPARSPAAATSPVRPKPAPSASHKATPKPASTPSSTPTPSVTWSPPSPDGPCPGTWSPGCTPSPDGPLVEFAAGGTTAGASETYFSAPGVIDLSATQLDGTVNTYSGTYTVTNGVITSASITQTS